MFKKQKQQLELERQNLEKEKEQLLFIRQQLENNSPKIDISHVYVYFCDSIKYIVKLQVDNCVGQNFMDKLCYGKSYKLIDIFSNNILFEKSVVDIVTFKEVVNNNNLRVFPICSIVPELIAYFDKKIPDYILKQIYLNLNNVDISSPILKKVKK